MGIVKKKTARKSSKNATADGHSYVTKRILVTGAQAAGREASANAMAVMGYVIVVEDGNVVRKNADGTTEVISPLSNEDQTLDLD